MIHIKIRLRTARKLKNNSHPVCLQITWGNEVRFKTIKGFTCKKISWDFEEHKYLHSQRKNDLLEEYLQKAQRVVDYMDEWDYNKFIKELERSEKKRRCFGRGNRYVCGIGGIREERSFAIRLPTASGKLVQIGRLSAALPDRRGSNAVGKDVSLPCKSSSSGR